MGLQPISLKCRLALDSVVYNILKLGHSSGWEGKGGMSSNSRTSDCCSHYVEMFPQILFFKTNRKTLYSINLLSKVPGNWPLNNLLVFSLKSFSKKFKTCITWPFLIPLGVNFRASLVIHFGTLVTITYQESIRELLHRKS